MDTLKNQATNMDIIDVSMYTIECRECKDTSRDWGAPLAESRAIARVAARQVGFTIEGDDEWSYKWLCPECQE